MSENLMIAPGEHIFLRIPTSKSKAGGCCCWNFNPCRCCCPVSGILSVTSSRVVMQEKQKCLCITEYTSESSVGLEEIESVSHYYDHCCDLCSRKALLLFKSRSETAWSLMPSSHWMYVKHDSASTVASMIYEAQRQYRASKAALQAPPRMAEMVVSNTPSIKGKLVDLFAPKIMEMVLRDRPDRELHPLPPLKS
jgi:hypothetical protein